MVLERVVGPFEPVIVSVTIVVWVVGGVELAGGGELEGGLVVVGGGGGGLDELGVVVVVVVGGGGGGTLVVGAVGVETVGAVLVGPGGGLESEGEEFVGLTPVLVEFIEDMVKVNNLKPGNLPANAMLAGCHHEIDLER